MIKYEETEMIDMITNIEKAMKTMRETEEQIEQSIASIGSRGDDGRRDHRASEERDDDECQVDDEDCRVDEERGVTAIPRPRIEEIIESAMDEMKRIVEKASYDEIAMDAMNENIEMKIDECGAERPIKSENFDEDDGRAVRDRGRRDCDR